MSSNETSNQTFTLQLASDSKVKIGLKTGEKPLWGVETGRKFQMVTFTAIQDVETGLYWTVRHAGYIGSLHNVRLEPLAAAGGKLPAPEQLFREERDPEGVRLVEGTANEYIGRGDNDMIVRWKREDNGSQVWTKVLG